MKCEICHKTDAETAIKIVKDGKEQELYVCSKCAKANQKNKAQKQTNDEEKPSEITDLEGLHEFLRSEAGSILDTKQPPKQLMDNFIKATMDMMTSLSKDGDEEQVKKCPKCGKTFDEIKDSEQIGCANCWKVFAKEIRKEFLALEFGLTHVGEAPEIKYNDTKNSKEKLKRQLKKALAKEDFLLAAKIQKKLEQLEQPQPTVIMIDEDEDEGKTPDDGNNKQ